MTALNVGSELVRYGIEGKKKFDHEVCLSYLSNSAVGTFLFEGSNLYVRILYILGCKHVVNLAQDTF